MFEKYQPASNFDGHIFSIKLTVLRTNQNVAKANNIILTQASCLKTTGMILSRTNVFFLNSLI